MLDFAIGMTCAPRVDGATIYKYPLQTIPSLRAAGFTEPLHLFCEPGDIYLPPAHEFNYSIHTNDIGLGCFLNWKQGLCWLLEHVPARAYLMLQDDCIWSTRGAGMLRGAIREPRLFGPSVGFISPYTSKSMVRNAGKAGEPRGWTPAVFFNKAFWGAVALCLTPEGARDLQGVHRFATHAHHRKLDVVVGNSFRDLNRQMFVHVPSLCQHIGDYSTLGRHKFKQLAWGRRGFKFNG